MKRIVSVITAILMCASSVFAVCAEEVTEEEINEGFEVNHHKVAEAVLSEEEEGKVYRVDIINPGGKENGGADKWDVQFRYRGISIEEGHEYTITYRISSSEDGYYYTKISNYNSETVGAAVAGEVWHNQFGVSTMMSYAKGIIKKNKNTNYGDAWSMQEISKGDTISTVCKFTAEATLPEAEWTFFLGGPGDATPTGCFKAGTILLFSNLTLTDNTTGECLISYGADISSNLRGDLNGDEIVDLTDLTFLSLALNNDIILDDTQYKNADFNNNGEVNIADLALLKVYLTDLEKSLK